MELNLFAIEKSRMRLNKITKLNDMLKVRLKENYLRLDASSCNEMNWMRSSFENSKIALSIIARLFYVNRDVFSNFHGSNESFTALFLWRVSFQHARSNFMIDTWLKTVAKLVGSVTPDKFNARRIALFSEQAQCHYILFYIHVPLLLIVCDTG